MKLLKCLLSLALLLVQLCPSFISSVYALEKVNLQLKWTHEFQFAGYYAAKEKGYYDQVGLDVNIREADPSLDVNEEVVSGRAQYGVGTSSLILERKAGKPLVVLAVIFQHSPQIILLRNGSTAQSVHDIKGKRLMLEPQSDELVAYLKAEGISLNNITMQKHSFDVQDLVDGLTDAMSAYSFSEPYYLDRAKFDYQAFTPRSDGIDFYGDNFFTSEAEINQHPERVKAFRDASLRGWDYALAHPDEIIDLILKKYPNKNRPNTREFLRFEADKVSELMRSDLLATGYMNPGRWRHIADTYAGLGMLPPDFSLDHFLYEPNPAINFKLIYSIIAATLLFACVAGVITFYILRVNRRLAQSLDELKAGELKLKLLSMAIEHSPTSVIITGPDTRIRYVNSQFTKETGYSADDAYGKTPRFLQSGLTRMETYQNMWAHLSQGKLWSGELINRRKSGEVYWEEAHISPVNDENGKLTHYVAVKLDITERKHASDRLAHMAHHDGLTNLPNRILFFERVEQGLALARRNHTKLALMFIDLDRFKPINDNFGHAVGDVILQEVAKRMLDCVREADTVGRIGGDEFIGLMLDIGDIENAEVLATKICKTLSIPFNVSGHLHHLSASIGVAVYPDHGHDEISLAKSADLAMYYAKASGRNNVKIFQSDMKNLSIEQ
ncbi:diguanylate cyclase domain-containing protein [Undibacterium sp. Ji67W]|uniref:diguanylate cyclase domain-containing protein n=1 Tax=Undibacterium sp. Ji67W TaxID=3413042 RepID=UPI003BF24F63